MAGSEEVQAKRDLLSGIDTYCQANKELETLKSELRGKEVACYISGGDSCIQKYDNFRIKYAMMNREHERDLESSTVAFCLWTAAISCPLAAYYPNLEPEQCFSSQVAQSPGCSPAQVSAGTSVSLGSGQGHHHQPS